MSRRLMSMGRICSSPIAGIYVVLIIIPLITLFSILLANDSLARDSFTLSPSMGRSASEGGTSVLSPDVILRNRIAQVSERIKHAEMLNQERKTEILLLRGRLNSLLESKSSPSPAPTENNNSQFLSPSLQLSASTSTSLKPVASYSLIHSDFLQLPSLSSFLPHLLVPFFQGKSDPLKPAFLRKSTPSSTSSSVSRSSDRFQSNNGSSTSTLRMDKMATIVFGIPTVKRPVESYLLGTLLNLIENMTPSEKSQSIIVVFIAETDEAFIIETTRQIEEQFIEYIESGLIEIIAPPASYYPDMADVKATLGDSLERTKWRTKQNLDFAYLMMYCQPKGTYYVQLEDDILTKPQFTSKMINFALKQSHSKDWFLLDFCQLGFIGKMFKSRDLSMFALMFVIFRHDKPVDWILGEIGRLKYCRNDIEAKECRRVLNNHWLFFRPSLFQHIGTHSSLKGKVQKLKDRQFGHVAMFSPHFDNPPALVDGTIKQYQSYSIDKAYRGETHFWGFSPVAGDVLYFNFTPPLLISRFLFRSGNNEHPQDKFPLSTIIDVLPESPESDFTSTGTSISSPHSSRDHDTSSPSSTRLFNSHSHPSNASSSSSSSSASPSSSSSYSTIDRSFISSSPSQERGVTGHPSLSPSIVSADSSRPKLTSRVKTTDGFVQITRFKSNGIAEALIGEEIGKIKCLRIRCPVASEKWVILSEIWIKKA